MKTIARFSFPQIRCEPMGKDPSEALDQRDKVTEILLGLLPLLSFMLKLFQDFSQMLI